MNTEAVCLPIASITTFFDILRSGLRAKSEGAVVETVDGRLVELASQTKDSRTQVAPAAMIQYFLVLFLSVVSSLTAGTPAV